MKKLMLLPVLCLIFVDALMAQQKGITPFECGAKYTAGDTTKSIDNLISTMNSSIYIMQASNLNYYFRMQIDNSVRSKSIPCNVEYKKAADEHIRSLASGVKNSFNSEKSQDIVIDAYSAWLTYLDSFSAMKDEGDPRAEYEYKLAINKLKALSL